MNLAMKLKIIQNRHQIKNISNLHKDAISARPLSPTMDYGFALMAGKRPL
jgi:hypothetical protein